MVALQFAPKDLTQHYGQKLCPLHSSLWPAMQYLAGSFSPRLVCFFQGVQTLFSTLQTLLQANQKRLHTIQSSLDQQLSFFTICYHTSSLPSAWAAREGGVFSDLLSDSDTNMLYMTRNGDRCLWKIIPWAKYDLCGVFLCHFF